LTYGDGVIEVIADYWGIGIVVDCRVIESRVDLFAPARRTAQISGRVRTIYPGQGD
jgi:hypothetical protein